MFLLLIVSGSCLAEGLLSTEEKQTHEILKRLEAKIEKQDAIIDELQNKNKVVTNELTSQNEALRRDMSELVERMERRAERTEEALETIRDSEQLGATTGEKAVRDLPYIMMCAYQSSWTTAGIIAYDELTLDYSNCDRPGGGCGTMDIASGIFTAQTGGLYTVTFSGQADLYESSALVLVLHHNGSELKESQCLSRCDTGCEEMFSRTLVSNYLSTCVHYLARSL